MFDTDFLQLYHRRGMNQRGPRPRIAIVFAATLGLLSLVAAGCDRRSVSSTAPAKSPTVASLVPAATEMLLDMGAGDHLVAVSDFDDEPRVAGLPHVGGYNSTDWEKLSRIRPNVIVSFYGTTTPPGFIEHCRELNIRQVNLKLNRLDDIYESIAALGGACDEQAKADGAVRRVRGRIEDVHRRVAGSAPVRALIVTHAAPPALAGRDTFLDDVLREAGGQNVIAATGYVRLDPEALAALNPQVILLLLPDADAREVAAAKAFWDAFPNMAAVKEHRVWAYTQDYIMHSGPHVADVAEKFAAALHPDVKPTLETSTTRAAP